MQRWPPVSDYLWDKEGEPDPEIEHLERVLAPLMHRPMLSFPPAAPRSRRPWVVGLIGVGAAAAVAIALFLSRPKPPEQAGLLMSVRGPGAMLADRPVTGDGKLTVGAWLDTGESKVTLTVGRIGTIEIGAKSRLRVIETSAQRQVLELDRGMLVAQIAAPPRSFTVKTKHAAAIDLGCAFSLRTDPSGEGRLIVTQGSVALAGEQGAEIAVAAGSECGISDRGPGVPFPSDVTEAFRDAMLRYPHDHAALAKIMEQARAKDRDALERLSAVSDPADRVEIERRVVALKDDGATKPLEKAAPPHEGKVKPSRKHAHAVKAASHVVPAASQAAPHVAPSVPSSSKKAPAAPTHEKLEHDPFRSND